MKSFFKNLFYLLFCSLELELYICFLTTRKLTYVLFVVWSFY